MAKDKGKRYKFRGERRTEPRDGDPTHEHEVTAVEVTQEHVDAGRAGQVGDYLVTRDGHAEQWWERDTFLDQYEPA